jgi:hypothetical protein
MKVTAIETYTVTKEVEKRIECDKCGLPDVELPGLYEVFECRLEITEGNDWPGERVATTEPARRGCRSC